MITVEQGNLRGTCHLLVLHQSLTDHLIYSLRLSIDVIGNFILDNFYSIYSSKIYLHKKTFILLLFKFCDVKVDYKLQLVIIT